MSTARLLSLIALVGAAAALIVASEARRRGRPGREDGVKVRSLARIDTSYSLPAHHGNYVVLFLSESYLVLDRPRRRDRGRCFLACLISQRK